MFLKLYHFGATLINSGNIYSGQPITIDTFNQTSFQINPDGQANKQKLLDAYNELPTERRTDGTLATPLHSLFVISTALDHMPAEGIYEVYKNLGVKEADMTRGGVGNSITLPDGTTFSDASGESILSLYIITHVNRFEHLFSEDELNELCESKRWCLHFLGIKNISKSGDLVDNTFKPSAHIETSNQVQEISEDIIENLSELPSLRK